MRRPRSGSITKSARQKDRAKGGIGEWRAKVATLKDAFMVQSLEGLADAICREAQMEVAMPRDMETIWNGLKRWGASEPRERGAHILVAGVAKFLARGGMVDIHTVRRVLLRGAAEELRALIDAHQRGIGVRVPTAGSDVGYPNAKLSRSGVLTVHTSRLASLESVQTGFRNGHIDLKHCYLDHESPNHWHSVARANEYTQYRECCDALNQVFNSKIWGDQIGTSDFSKVVALGGGSHIKDAMALGAVIRCSRQPRQKLEYLLIDCSYYMVCDTRDRLEKELRQNYPEVWRQVNFANPLIEDFTHMDDQWDRLRTTSGQALWFLPGGTFGNVDERKLVRQLASVARKGDLLLLGVETCPPGNLTLAYREALRTKYSAPEVRSFVSPVVDKIFLRNGYTNRQDALAALRVDLLENSQEGEYSSVPNSLTVFIDLPPKGASTRGVVVLNSTRYREEELQEFLKMNRFEFLSAEAPNARDFPNSQYRQFLLRFVG